MVEVGGVRALHKVLMTGKIGKVVFVYSEPTLVWLVGGWLDGSDVLFGRDLSVPGMERLP